MKKWSAFTPWVTTAARGQQRFERFRSEYPDAIFVAKGKQISITAVQTFDEVRGFFGITRGVNPHAAKIQIIAKPNDKVRDLVQLDDPLARVSGTKAAQMETLVAIAVIGNIKTYSDLRRITSSKELTDDLIKRCNGITKAEIDGVMEALEDDVQYAKSFLSIASNIQKNTSIKHSSDYYVYNRKKWHKFKSNVTKLLDERVRGDKWNPADILFVRNGFNFDASFVIEGNISDFNDKFNHAVEQGNILPISIKKDQGCIMGCRGITNEIPTKVDHINIAKIIRSGELAGIPIGLSYSETRHMTSETTNYKRVLGWIHAVGAEHVAKTVMIAAGLVPWSSIWYVANDQECYLQHCKPTSHIKVEHIWVSLTSNSIWLQCSDGLFAVVRNKGHNDISVSIGSERKIQPYDINNLGDEQMKLLVETNQSQSSQPRTPYDYRDLFDCSLESMRANQNLYLQDPTHDDIPGIGATGIYKLGLKSLDDLQQSFERLDHQEKEHLVQYFSGADTLRVLHDDKVLELFLDDGYRALFEYLADQPCAIEVINLTSFGCLMPQVKRYTPKCYQLLEQYILNGEEVVEYKKVQPNMISMNTIGEIDGKVVITSL